MEYANEKSDCISRQLNNCNWKTTLRKCQKNIKFTFQGSSMRSASRNEQSIMITPISFTYLHSKQTTVNDKTSAAYTPV